MDNYDHECERKQLESLIEPYKKRIEELELELESLRKDENEDDISLSEAIFNLYLHRAERERHALDFKNQKFTQIHNIIWYTDGKTIRDEWNE